MSILEVLSLSDVTLYVVFATYVVTMLRTQHHTLCRVFSYLSVAVECMFVQLTLGVCTFAIRKRRQRHREQWIMIPHL